MSVRPVEASDRDAILALCRDIFALDRARLGPAWAWLFDANPVADETPLKGLVLEADGALVGHSGIIPQRFRVAGRELVLSFASAFCVAPGYRFHGTRLAHEFLSHRESRFPLTNSGNADTVAIYKFFGCREIPGLADNDYLMPVRVDRLVRHALSRSRHARRLTALRAFSPLLRWVGPAMSAVLGARADGAYRVSRCDAVDEEFDRLWKHLSGSYAVLSVRSREYLAWRYFGHPERPYGIFAARDGAGELAGYLACDVREHESGLKTLNVIDLFCDHANVRLVRALLGTAITEARSRGADAVRIRNVPERVKGLLPRMGFVRRRWPNKAVYRNNCGVADGVLASSGSWYCCTGDGDADAGMLPLARRSERRSPAVGAL